MIGSDMARDGSNTEDIEQGLIMGKATDNFQQANHPY